MSLDDRSQWGNNFNIMKNKKLILNHLLGAAVIMFLILPSLAFGGVDPTADPTGGNQGGKIEFKNPFKAETLDGLITIILDDIIMPIGYVIAALMVIYSGFLFVTSQGNETKIKAAKDALLYAVIGAIILLGATVITKALQGTVDQLRKP